MNDAVSVSFEGPLARVRLTRPDKLNAFNAELVEALLEAISEASGNGTRLMVFEGEGKGFSGGFDLGGLDEMSDGDLLLRFVRAEELLQAVYHAPFGTLALVHGPCYGAAADMVVACQWRVATADARFRMPGSRFGIVLGTKRLANILGADTARSLLLREKPFSADEAVSSGFVQQIVDQENWAAEIDGRLADVTALDSATFTALAGRMRADTRSEDMAALVRSATHSSIKERIASYLASLKR